MRDTITAIQLHPPWRACRRGRRRRERHARTGAAPRHPPALGTLRTPARSWRPPARRRGAAAPAAPLWTPRSPCLHGDRKCALELMHILAYTDITYSGITGASVTSLQGEVKFCLAEQGALLLLLMQRTASLEDVAHLLCVHAPTRTMAKHMACCQCGACASTSAARKGLGQAAPPAATWFAYKLQCMRTAIDVADVQAQVVAQAGVAENAVLGNAQPAHDAGLGGLCGRGRQRQQRAAGDVVRQQAAQAEVGRPAPDISPVTPRLQSLRVASISQACKCSACRF